MRTLKQFIRNSGCEKKAFLNLKQVFLTEKNVNDISCNMIRLYTVYYSKWINYIGVIDQSSADKNTIINILLA